MSGSGKPTGVAGLRQTLQSSGALPRDAPARASWGSAF